MESINNAGQMNNRSSFTVTSNGIFDKKSKRSRRLLFYQFLLVLLHLHRLGTFIFLFFSFFFFFFATCSFTAAPFLSDSVPETMINPSSYMTHLKLTVRHLTAKDYGPYRCVARNPRGETDGTIKIYRKLPWPRPSSALFP